MLIELSDDVQIFDLELMIFQGQLRKNRNHQKYQSLITLLTIALIEQVQIANI